MMEFPRFSSDRDRRYLYRENINDGSLAEEGGMVHTSDPDQSGNVTPGDTE